MKTPDLRKKVPAGLIKEIPKVLLLLHKRLDDPDNLLYSFHKIAHIC